MNSCSWGHSSDALYMYVYMHTWCIDIEMVHISMCVYTQKIYSTTHMHTDRHKHGQMDGQTDRHHTHMYAHAHTHTHTHRDIHTHSNELTDYRQTDRQTDKRAHSNLNDVTK